MDVSRKRWWMVRAMTLAVLTLWTLAVVLTTVNEVVVPVDRSDAAAVRAVGWLLVSGLGGVLAVVVRPQWPAVSSWRWVLATFGVIGLAETADVITATIGDDRWWMSSRHWFGGILLIVAVVVVGEWRGSGSGKSRHPARVAAAAVAGAAAIVLAAGWRIQGVPAVVVVATTALDVVRAVAWGGALLIITHRLMVRDARWRPPLLAVVLGIPMAALLFAVGLATRDDDRLYHTIGQAPIGSTVQLALTAVTQALSTVGLLTTLAFVWPTTVAVTTVSVWAGLAAVGQLTVAVESPTEPGSWVTVSAVTLLGCSLLAYYGTC